MIVCIRIPNVVRRLALRGWLRACHHLACVRHPPWPLSRSESRRRSLQLSTRRPQRSLHGGPRFVQQRPLQRRRHAAHQLSPSCPREPRDCPSSTSLVLPTASPCISCPLARARGKVLLSPRTAYCKSRSSWLAREREMRPGWHEVPRGATELRATRLQ